MSKLKPPKPVSKIKKVKKITKPQKIKRKKIYTADTVGTSKIEKDFFSFLLSKGIIVSEQHQIGHKFYDFILTGYKILIEFDGDYWHCNPEIYKEGPVNKMQKKAIENDKHKKILAESFGYKLIRVWEKDFKENPNEVLKYIKSKIKKYIENKKEIL